MFRYRKIYSMLLFFPFLKFFFRQLTKIFEVIPLPSSLRHPLGHYLRSDLKPERTSSEKSCGCSQAAKCPPLSCLL